MPQPRRPQGGFIHVSEAANLALHTAMLLAADPSRPLRIRQIGDLLPASENHLAKVLQRLGHARLVDSTRGPHGGFVLARAPERITLLEIYEAIEGPIQAHACLLGKKQCAGECILGDLVAKTNAAIKARLARTRLAAVAGAFERQDRS